MQLRIITFSTLLTFLFLHTATAQIADSSYNGVNDPFSYYGIGTVMYDGQQTSAMMGHTGAAHQSVYQVNTSNPASLANIRITTIDFSLQGISSNATTNNQIEKSGSFRPSYFYLTYPVGKNAGMTLGIDQKMSTLYRIRNNYNQPIGDTVTRATQQWVGNGSLNYINVSGAYRWRALNFGLRMDYNFGNQQTENYINYTDSTDILGTDYLGTTEYRGLGVELGAQYTHLLQPDSSKKIVLGMVYGISPQLSTTRESYSTNFFYRNSNRIDTFAQSDRERGTYNGPSKIKVGIGYTLKNKLEALVDYTQLSFADNYLYGDTLASGNFSKLSAGVSFTPKFESVKNTFSRSTYYMGFYTGKDYIRANDNEVTFWGITGGLSIPFGRRLSQLHLGIEYGSRGSVSSNLLRMQNTVYTIGISFSDLWFQKRYYN